LGTKSSFRRKLYRVPVVVSIAGAAALMPSLASAEGLFDFFFGGLQRLQRQVSPQENSSSNPFSNNPQPLPPAVASSGPAFCVRSCDGRYFPLTRGGGASAVQMCQAFCPASPTKVYFGSSIDNAYAANGERYADSENAYAYRKALRADCTCNGHDPAGLAPIDLSHDPSLRRGDVVATSDGLAAYSGVRLGNDQTPELTPIASFPGLTGEVRARLNEMKVAPARADAAANDRPNADPAPQSSPSKAAQDKRAEAN
jgi:hypothetical protein